MEDVARQLAQRVSERLPVVIQQLLQSGCDLTDESMQLECCLTTRKGVSCAGKNSVQVATINIGHDLSSVAFRAPLGAIDARAPGPATHDEPSVSALSEQSSQQRTWSASSTMEEGGESPLKRRKRSGSLSVVRTGRLRNIGKKTTSPVQELHDEATTVSQRKKKIPANPILLPSTFDKFVSGVWESIFSSVKINPTEVIEQWQAIESSGRPKLLTENDHAVANHSDIGIFERMNILTRKVCQTSRTCRSLEVIVQAYWVQCFDDRVAELRKTMTPEKSKKTAISEACTDFNWTEKELRNKMGIWKGYYDIKDAGGWAALVFAGMGLYRFCKYRVSFGETTFHVLHALRHRFEVAADTLHPNWRSLLGIVGISTERRYTGHPHDWVVNGVGNEAIPLPETYRQWDSNFTYTHLDRSELDQDAWGDYDPRTVYAPPDPMASTCLVCGERQSDEPAENSCTCFANLYGGPKAVTPVQIFRTPNGKNNGLLTCCTFESGTAVGEFVGLITSGINGKDVMVGQTEKATYQIWQGEAGNHTRFVNHSCQPNSQFERFVWMGKQRIVLVSNGIQAGEEITVDYSDTYWRDLDKICLCEVSNCRYRSRVRLDLPPLTPEEQSS